MTKTWRDRLVKEAIYGWLRYEETCIDDDDDNINDAYIILSPSPSSFPSEWRDLFKTTMLFELCSKIPEPSTSWHLWTYC